MRARKTLMFTSIMERAANLGMKQRLGSGPYAVYEELLRLCCKPIDRGALLHKIVATGTVATVTTVAALASRLHTHEPGVSQDLEALEAQGLLRMTRLEHGHKVFILGIGQGGSPPRIRLYVERYLDALADASPLANRPPVRRGRLPPRPETPPQAPRARPGDPRKQRRLPERVRKKLRTLRVTYGAEITALEAHGREDQA
jgi:hypothetical protein